jgi:hypothetical protein
MKQAIAGVAPAESAEVTVMTIWPSIAAFPSGCFLGRLYDIRWPNVYIFQLGRLLALLSIPHALFLYFWRVMPRVGSRYTLTNRRVVIEKGWPPVEHTSIGLDEFDSIDIDVLPGQEWFAAGDLCFRNGGSEVFRLAGVSRPEAFRQTCLKSRLAYVSVKQTLLRQTQSQPA